NLTRALQETGAAIQAFTPLYGAPEQFARKYGATGPWTDVFAFALVLVEVMTGRPALDGADTTQLFVSSMRLDRRPTPRAAGLEVTDAVELVFARALAVDPKARFPSVGAFWPALVAETAHVPVPAALAATAYGPAPTAGAAMALAATALAPTRMGPSTTAPQMASMPAAPLAVPTHPGPAHPSRVWIAVVAVAGAVVVGAALVVALVALRVAREGPTVGSGLGGVPSAAALRATAAQKVTRKDPSCLADLAAAERLDPGGTPPTLEPMRAYCEMIAGKCEQGRRRYREYILQNSPSAGVEVAANAVVAQYCPRDQLTPGERAVALSLDVNAAWQRGDTNQCVSVGNDLVATLDVLPDRTGAQQTERAQAAAALGTASQCAAKGGRCDDARTFYRARMHALTKQPPTAATDADFRAAHPECAKK
ncbi:MAG TPA: hypothetical protein VHS09_14160, partial [Polyangiaceae bacterium]|nr:hypothetical protein [Polyangiaceae bacterium]